MSRQEADYLAAILNAEATNEAIKPFQSMGLMGERDIETKVLGLPIPKYAPENPTHKALAELGAKARDEALNVVRASDLPASLARRRQMIRAALKSTLAAIDTHVRKLLAQSETET